MCICVGQPISGPELATLLEVLVTAANEGSLAEVARVVSNNAGILSSLVEQAIPLTLFYSK